MNVSVLKSFGWTAMILVAILAAGTVWLFSTIREPVGSLPSFVAQTSGAAAEAIAARATTTFA